MTTRLIAKTARGKGGNNLTRLYNCRTQMNIRCLQMGLFGGWGYFLGFGFFLFLRLTGKREKKPE